VPFGATEVPNAHYWQPTPERPAGDRYERDRQSEYEREQRQRRWYPEVEKERCTEQPRRDRNALGTLEAEYPTDPIIDAEPIEPTLLVGAQFAPPGKGSVESDVGSFGIGRSPDDCLDVPLSGSELAASAVVDAVFAACLAAVVAAATGTATAAAGPAAAAPEVAPAAPPPAVVAAPTSGPPVGGEPSVSGPPPPPLPPPPARRFIEDA